MCVCVWKGRVYIVSLCVNDKKCFKVLSFNGRDNFVCCNSTYCTCLLVLKPVFFVCVSEHTFGC